MLGSAQTFFTHSCPSSFLPPPGRPIPWHYTSVSGGWHQETRHVSVPLTLMKPQVLEGSCTQGGWGSCQPPLTLFPLRPPPPIIRLLLTITIKTRPDTPLTAEGEAAVGRRVSGVSGAFCHHWHRGGTWIFFFLSYATVRPLPPTSSIPRWRHSEPPWGGVGGVGSPEERRPPHSFCTYRCYSCSSSGWLLFYPVGLVRSLPRTHSTNQMSRWHILSRSPLKICLCCRRDSRWTPLRPAKKAKQGEAEI